MLDKKFRYCLENKASACASVSA